MPPRPATVVGEVGVGEVVVGKGVVRVGVGREVVVDDGDVVDVLGAFRSDPNDLGEVVPDCSGVVGAFRSDPNEMLDEGLDDDGASVRADVPASAQLASASAHSAAPITAVRIDSPFSQRLGVSHGKVGGP
jgi:hypothetical protein